VHLLRELIEWQTFESLEPFESFRADYRAAQIVQTVCNLMRDSKKRPNPYTLQECVLPFGDAADARHGGKPTRRQSWQEQKEIFKMYAMTAERDAQAARRRKK